MPLKPMKSGGGWKAIYYSLKMANRVGWLKLWTAMRSKNACKTCALGMGGQAGGMVNEGGHFPEVCKKSFQAMVSDMQAGITPEFFEKYSLADLRALSPRELEYCGRLVFPVYAGPGDTHYRRIEWTEAIDRIGQKLKASGPEHSFFYASGRSSNEAGFLLQLLSRQFGTNYVNNCSYYCHQASGVGLSQAVGSGTGTIQLHDLDHCDLYLLIGGNPASNHPRMMRSLMQIRRNGGQVVVVNPVKELGLVNFSVPSDVRSLLFGSKIASQYVQPHIGGDLAWMAGVAKSVLENGGQEPKFISERTEGFDEFFKSLQALSWAEIEQSSGVTRESIRQTAELYMQAKNVVIGWTMGITHHLHGVRNVRMIANLALLRGMVGRDKAGLMPIRGHSNVQGIGSVGVTPVLKGALLQRFEERLGIKIPKSPGLDTMACVNAAFEGQMQAALCLGGNLYGSNPDAHYALKAMRNIDLIAYMSTTLNTGHAWGLGKETIILPVLPRDEEPQPTTQESMFSFVRLSEGGKPRYVGPRSEVSILIEIAQKIFGADSPIDWEKLKRHSAIRELIGDLIPGYEPIAKLDENKQEFHITGRHPQQFQFLTASGKAQFQAVTLPAPPAAGELRLMTVRSEGQFNSVVYEDQDIYRGQERRDVILLHPDDISARGLKTDQFVTVKSATGTLPRQLVRAFDIRPGNALMYYPETNVLIPRDVDPESKTPAFKSIKIELIPE